MSSVMCLLFQNILAVPFVQLMDVHFVVLGGDYVCRSVIACVTPDDQVYILIFNVKLLMFQ